MPRRRRWWSSICPFTTEVEGRCWQGVRLRKAPRQSSRKQARKLDPASSCFLLQVTLVRSKMEIQIQGSQLSVPNPHCDLSGPASVRFSQNNVGTRALGQRSRNLGSSPGSATHQRRNPGPPSLASVSWAVKLSAGLSGLQGTAVLQQICNLEAPPPPAGQTLEYISSLPSPFPSCLSFLRFSPPGMLPILSTGL